MQNLYKKKALRIIVSVGVPICAILFALFCYLTKKTPPCIFYHATGLYCFGCGTGRALLSLLNGEIYAAFRYHPLLPFILPFVLYYLLKIYLAFLLGKDKLPDLTVKKRWVGITVATVIIAFGILRNIPIFPFNLLAPTAV